MPFYDAVLFDFGDTLFHRAGGPPLLVELSGGGASEEDAARVWDEVQQRARTAEALAKGRDLGLDVHRREWVALYSAFDVFADGLGAAVYEHEMGPTGWVPFTDVKPTLQALRAAGIKTGIVSDTGWDIRVPITHGGIANLVDAYALSYEVGVIKPAPEMFLAACEQLDVAPNRVLMVGDNPVADAGALAVGMPVHLLPLTPPRGPRGLDAVLRLAGVAES